MLELKNIVKIFPQAEAPVLDNINLTVHQDDYCIILGSNGSGKSTLLKIILGEYSADSGSVFLNKIDITDKPTHIRACEIGSVVQDLNKGTVQEMTLLENITLSNMRNRKASFSGIKRYKEEIIENIKMLELGLEKFIDCEISSLSGGQRQTIATLAAMTPKPSLLLLDEHTSALDPLSKQIIMDFTDRYVRDNHIMTLMITHNIHDALTYGNRLIIMNHGKIVYDIAGPEKKILKEKDILDIFCNIGEFV